MRTEPVLGPARMSSLAREMAGTVDRIAASTSIIRTRVGDDGRANRLGGSPDEFRARVERGARRLRKIADDLEKLTR